MMSGKVILGLRKRVNMAIARSDPSES